MPDVCHDPYFFQVFYRIPWSALFFMKPLTEIFHRIKISVVCPCGDAAFMFAVAAQAAEGVARDEALQAVLPLPAQELEGLVTPRR